MPRSKFNWKVKGTRSKKLKSTRSFAELEKLIKQAKQLGQKKTT